MTRDPGPREDRNSPDSRTSCAYGCVCHGMGTPGGLGEPLKYRGSYPETSVIPGSVIDRYLSTDAPL